MGSRGSMGRTTLGPPARAGGGQSALRSLPACLPQPSTSQPLNGVVTCPGRLRKPRHNPWQLQLRDSPHRALGLHLPWLLQPWPARCRGQQPLQPVPGEPPFCAGSDLACIRSVHGIVEQVLTQALGAQENTFTSDAQVTATSCTPCGPLRFAEPGSVRPARRSSMCSSLQAHYLRASPWTYSRCARRTGSVPAGTRSSGTPATTLTASSCSPASTRP